MNRSLKLSAKHFIAAQAALLLTAGMATGAMAGHHEKGEMHQKGAMKEVPAKAMNVAKTNDIVDIAVGAGQFNTLAAALDAAGLVGTLKGDGPFTVFAPTDAAFAKLPKGTVESLLKPENKEKLISILTYHVVSGKVPASDVVNLSSATTVNGANVSIKVADGGVKVDNANVVKTDIMASNGIIHVIDSVILPN